MFVLVFVNSWLISNGFKFWMIKAAFVLIGQAEISSFIVPSLFLETADRALAVVATINLRGPVELFSGCDRRRTFRHLPRLERSRHCILLI